MNSFEDLGIVGILIIIAAIVITILMVIAVLTIPKIAKYQKATLKLTALIAKKNGVAIDEIKTILGSGDEKIRSEFDYQMDKFLDYGD
jgi:hypothetical protein